MGASLTMIDRHYGHLARDGREHAIRLQRPPWTLVDAGWTPGSRTPAAETTEAALSRRNPKPSDGHEPSTPPYDGSSEASGEIERGYASTEREGDTAPSHDSVLGDLLGPHLTLAPNASLRTCSQIACNTD
jgi:hypothetical protein